MKGKKVKAAIPKEFPYFYVEFSLDNGFAHVIEDYSKFPKHFGKVEFLNHFFLSKKKKKKKKEVIGGMLECDPSLWLKPRKQGFEMEKQKTIDFAKKWEKYDWTKELE